MKDLRSLLIQQLKNEKLPSGKSLDEIISKQAWSRGSNSQDIYEASVKIEDPVRATIRWEIVSQVDLLMFNKTRHE